MERLGEAPPETIPIALSTEGRHGPVIHTANRTARLAGVSVGARVVDVRAVCPELQVEYADLGGDAQALERLMLWVRRWCPWSVVDGPDGLILDTTGSDHLMGGEAAMLAEMEARLSLLGLSSQLAIAPTWGAAWGLARYGGVRHICAEGEVQREMAPLPVSALRLNADTLLVLRRLGLKTVGALAEVPRLSLTRRFSRAELNANPLLRLDQATGQLAEPVASVDARPPIVADARLPEPILDPTAYLPELLRDLCGQLETAGLGCRRLHLTVYRTDGEVSTISAATAAPSRDPKHLGRLFKDKLERINPGFGFDLISLWAKATETIGIVQTRLDEDADNQVELSRLIDRLVARLGEQSVQRPEPVPSHVPERAQVWKGALGGGGLIAASLDRDRPIRLLAPPEEVRVLYAVPEGPPVQFMWRRQQHRVARFAGPERIAPEWWQDRPSARLRDYFKVETSGGVALLALPRGTGR